MEPSFAHFRLMLAALLVGSVFAAPNAAAQNALSMSVASDILFPASSFSEAYNTGFGGNIQLRYSTSPVFQIGLTTGFFSWAVKDGQGATDLKGIPIRGLAIYEFANPVYLMLEGGVFLGWNSGGSGESSTDFGYAVGFGVQPALSKDGDIRLDASLRYEGVARDTSPVNNVVLRIGVTFTVID